VDPKEIKEQSLLVEIERFTGEHQDGGNWRQELKSLAADIRSLADEYRPEDSSRLAAFADLARQIDRDTGGIAGSGATHFWCR
jgi:hypothetical protein